MDEQCAAAGRDPVSVARSLLLFESLDAWTAPDMLERMVDLFVPAGVSEFVMFWPPPDEEKRLEALHGKLALLR
jgi:hypothetical protein